MAEQQEMFPDDRYKPPRFDAAESWRRKESGMEASAMSRSHLLIQAQRVAMRLAIRFGRVTADDVQQALCNDIEGYEPSMLGPAAGSIFKGSKWKFTGERVKSTQVKNHARELKVWALKD